MHDEHAPSSPTEFDSLLSAERPKLVRIASRILCDQHEAEDVVQSTVTIVWSQSERLAPRQLRAYLCRAVELNALKIRARKRMHRSIYDAEEVPAACESMDESISSIDPFELEMAIADLPLSQQTILRLKFYTGLSFRQISEQLKISQNTAASRCRYALAKMKEYFEKRGKYGSK